MEKYNFYAPTKILFGCGRLNDLYAQTLPGTNGMVVISNGKSTRENGYLDRLCDQLELANVTYHIFDKIGANPTRAQVMEGSRFANTNNCDFIVALGGGSVMDAAKAIALTATNDGDYWDYIGTGTGKGKSVKNRPLPIVAITTTAGPGSEADSASVITNEETNEKTGFGHPSLFPVLSVVDPQLTLSVPPRFTAYQGFDALFHSIECYVSNKANLLGDMYALTAIEKISNNLARAVKDGSDIDAREKIAFANTLSGTVMTISGCTSEHSLEHAMSAYHFDLPHGAGLIMISKAYFEYFIENHACDERFMKMAQVMGVSGAKCAADFITALERLKVDCGVADLKMSDYGITRDEFEKMARNAMGTMGRLFLNDRIELSLDDCIKIYEKSFM